MPSGSCLCGGFKYEWLGEAQAVVACHCPFCRKSSGTTNGINLIISSSDFKVLSGQTLQWTRNGTVSGKDITYNSCAICGTLLFLEPEALPSVKSIRLGTVDDEDVLQKSKPHLETFTSHRLAWCPIFDVPQLEGQPGAV